MNLKESFRYQKFLDNLMWSAKNSIQNREHSLKITRYHLIHNANPDADDAIETVECSEPFFPNDQVIEFMKCLVCEKDNLSHAISAAKEKAEIDIDAAIETNKFNRSMVDAIKGMMRFNPYKRTERGSAYKFDVNGVQQQYSYDIQANAEEAFDRAKAKDTVRKAVADADRLSAAIDAAMINTVVNYEPPFDVNDSFEDAMSIFVESLGKQEA